MGERKREEVVERNCVLEYSGTRIQAALSASP